MSLCTNRRAYLEARLARKIAQLEKAYTAYDELIENNVEQYRFNSNEGSQWAERRKLEQLTKIISTLESEIESLQNRLCGLGIVNINLRRKRYG
jgi:virulence-associated protein VapD